MDKLTTPTHSNFEGLQLAIIFFSFPVVHPTIKPPTDMLYYIRFM